ncbi:uncharacterized protein LOC106866693 [Brachypodium distachyon]|uniref:uncharacterized protein LOC106866693 n=1 Tax=Brachypodium distachyon TaxID=15368 RepID=UPI00071CD375|nr:uncharacterized protein LOC106866693 [Brachypodium distachyon]|eukprot:XP_014757812.1 uncharacterized protein LOC106866693 [Brachypodium distachyon]
MNKVRKQSVKDMKKQKVVEDKQPLELNLEKEVAVKEANKKKTVQAKQPLELNEEKEVPIKEAKKQKNVEAKQTAKALDLKNASKLSDSESKKRKIVQAKKQIRKKKTVQAKQPLELNKEKKVLVKEAKKQKNVEAKQTAKALDLKNASKVSDSESKKRKIVECQQTVVDLELDVDEQVKSKRKQAANKETTNVTSRENSMDLKESVAGSSKVCFDQIVYVAVNDCHMFSGPNENLLRRPRGKSSRVALPDIIDRLKKDFVPQGDVLATQLGTNEFLQSTCDPDLEVTSKVNGEAPKLISSALGNLCIYDTDSACSGDFKNAESLHTGDVSNSVPIDVHKSADLEHKEGPQAVLDPEASGATENAIAKKDAQIILEAPSESKKKEVSKASNDLAEARSVVNLDVKEQQAFVLKSNNVASETDDKHLKDELDSVLKEKEGVVSVTKPFIPIRNIQEATPTNAPETARNRSIHGTFTDPCIVDDKLADSILKNSMCRELNFDNAESSHMARNRKAVLDCAPSAPSFDLGIDEINDNIILQNVAPVASCLIEAKETELVEASTSDAKEIEVVVISSNEHEVAVQVPVDVISE